MTKFLLEQYKVVFDWLRFAGFCVFCSFVWLYLLFGADFSAVRAVYEAY